jgi:hypothetical protein
MAIKQKILLGILPYWTPLVPPQGISYLKHFLQHHGYSVKTVDANTETEFKAIYDKYFGILETHIPKNKQGNFYNIGHDVLRNHMIAHIHYTDEEDYLELTKDIIYETYFTLLSRPPLLELKEILDLFFVGLERYMLTILQREEPRVLGISVLRDTIAPSLFAFQLTRQRYPHIQTVMGGSVFADHLRIDSPNFQYFLERTPYIDKIIVGEGQLLLLRLLQGELPENQRVFTLKDINGQRLGNSPLNFPDMTDFDVGTNYPYLSAQASSSCPNQCSFCNVAAFFGVYREKDPARVVAEMIEFYKTYGSQLFYMNDALLNFVATNLAEEFIKSGVALYWDGYLRVDDPVANIENTLLWRRGGMYRVRLGVESGSQYVLDLMDKKITPLQTKQALTGLANAGIKTTTYWVIGHPGETEEDFLQTLELLEETKNNIYEAECNPFIFGYTGQAHTDRWKDKRVLLYPAEAKKMLILQSWKVDDSPTREETYKRVNRFIQRCQELGIPNPYSMQEIYQADQRWKKLHQGAVPCLADFKSRETYIDECKKIKQVSLLKPTLKDNGDFGF